MHLRLCSWKTLTLNFYAKLSDHNPRAQQFCTLNIYSDLFPSNEFMIKI